MNFFQFLFVPTLVFLVVVMPIWLTMHYRYKARLLDGASDIDQQQLDEMLRTIDKVMDRVETLESILDERQPNWRRQAD